MSCQLYFTATLLPKKQTLEPNGWEAGRNSESVRLFWRRGSGSCYQFGGDDDDNDGKDGKKLRNEHNNLCAPSNNQDEKVKLNQKQQHKSDQML